MRFEQILVGFSGGLDSTVLLHALQGDAHLREKLLVVHIHHGISPNADLWQSHCQAFCTQLGVNFFTRKVEFDRAKNIEEGARNARFAVFRELMQANKALVLGHHSQDQAETLLLNLFRGSGVDGLAGMLEQADFHPGVILRPFLAHTRQALLDYAQTHNLEWIEDESNSDTHYSRNYLREMIFPLLQEKWPHVNHQICRTAEIMQNARINLDAMALLDLDTCQYSPGVLKIKPLLDLPRSRAENALRHWIIRNAEVIPSCDQLNCIFDEVLLAKVDALPLVKLKNIAFRRYQDRLYMLDYQSSPIGLKTLAWSDFPESLNLGTKCLVVEEGDMGILLPKKARIEVSFRKGGETILLHGQHKSLKKLFQEWGIPPWLRDEIPLVYINDTLAVVVGYATSELFAGGNLTFRQINS